MAILAPRRPRRRVQLTPLIDVIFLLVIFFVSTSSFLPTARLALTSPNAEEKAEAIPGDAPARETGETAALPPAAWPLLVTVRGDGEVTVNGEPVAAEGLVAQLAAWSAAGADRALVQARGQATVQDLTRVVEAARAAGLVRVGLRP